jgi:hypothetical protein
MIADSYICYLADHNVPFRHFLLVSSLQQLKLNFLSRFAYPVIIFHETGYPEEYKNQLLQIYNNITFHEAKFKPPKSLPADALNFESSPDGFMGMGYRNMCRFFMTEFFETLITKYNAKYYMRLDTDSIIFEPLQFDPFEVINKGGYVYGYVGDIMDGGDDKGLTNYCLDYCKRNNIELKWRDKFIKENNYKTRSVYNNFEILNLNLIQQPKILDFIRDIDKTGNIYKYRWGDAPLRTFMLSMTVEREQIYRFRNISYIHGAIFMQRFGAINSPYVEEEWRDNNDWIGVTLNY